MLELCKHLERSIDRTEDGARHACLECRLLAEVLKGGKVEVRPMVSLTRKVGCR